MASSLYGSLLMLLMLVYVPAQGQASTDHIVLPTAQNEGICSLEIKVRTGESKTDGDVSLRIYDSENSEVIDIASIDGPDDNFEINQVDTFVYNNQPCFRSICAAKVRHTATSTWSFESIDLKVKSSDGKVLSHLFAAYGKALSSSALNSLPSFAMVGSCT